MAIGRHVTRSAFATLLMPALVTLGLISNGCTGAIDYSAEPIEAVLVDDVTKQPLPGALVIAHWVLEGGIHVGPVAELVVMESITDKKGKFMFPGWGPVRHYGRSRLTNLDPQILIYRDGYEYRSLANSATKTAIEGKTVGLRRSDWNGKTIELKRFRGAPQQYANEFTMFNMELDSMVSRNPENCDWKKLPRTIVFMMEQKKKLQSATPLSSIDQELISNSDYFEAKGGRNCGSPRQFILGLQ